MSNPFYIAPLLRGNGPSSPSACARVAHVLRIPDGLAPDCYGNLTDEEDRYEYEILETQPTRRRGKE